MSMGPILAQAMRWRAPVISIAAVAIVALIWLAVRRPKTDWRGTMVCPNCGSGSVARDAASLALGGDLTEG